MRKTKNLFLILLVILVAVALAGCKKKTDTQTTTTLETTEETISENDSSNQSFGLQPKEWQVHTNEKYGYKVKYPLDWFYMEDACCPPPPAFVNFNNISSKKLEYSRRQTEEGVKGIDFLCMYEGKIDDIGEVKAYKEEGVAGELTKINGFDAIKFTRNVVPGNDSKNVLSYYIVDGTQGCRSTFTDDCDECTKIISSFKFI